MSGRLFWFILVSVILLALTITPILTSCTKDFTNKVGIPVSNKSSFKISIKGISNFTDRSGESTIVSLSVEPVSNLYLNSNYYSLEPTVKHYWEGIKHMLGDKPSDIPSFARQMDKLGVPEGYSATEVGEDSNGVYFLYSRIVPRATSYYVVSSAFDGTVLDSSYMSWTVDDFKDIGPDERDIRKIAAENKKRIRNVEIKLNPYDKDISKLIEDHKVLAKKKEEDAKERLLKDFKNSGMSMLEFGLTHDISKYDMEAKVTPQEVTNIVNRYLKIEVLSFEDHLKVEHKNKK